MHRQQQSICHRLKLGVGGPALGPMCGQVQMIDCAQDIFDIALGQNRAAVIALGSALLAAAALFQLADAGQVMALGLLRGVQDTRVPMVIAAISYWLVGVPLSYVFGFVLGWGGVGVWLGLAVGLAGAGGFMMHRFWARALRRLAQDAAAGA